MGISLPASVPANEFCNLTSAFYLYSATVRAEVTRNIATSPGSNVSGHCNRQPNIHEKPTTHIPQWKKI